MAIRNDITVDWYDSPRTIIIAAPSVTITVQDLHDTLVSIQDSLEGSEFPDLVSSSGKGGGVTGIVSILQNAEVLFEGDWQSPGVSPAQAKKTVMSAEAFQTLYDLFVPKVERRPQVRRPDVRRQGGPSDLPERKPSHMIP